MLNTVSLSSLNYLASLLCFDDKTVHLHMSNFLHFRSSTSSQQRTSGVLMSSGVLGIQLCFRPPRLMAESLSTL